VYSTHWGVSTDFPLLKMTGLSDVHSITTQICQISNLSFSILLSLPFKNDSPTHFKGLGKSQLDHFCAIKPSTIGFILNSSQLNDSYFNPKWQTNMNIYICIPMELYKPQTGNLELLPWYQLTSSTRISANNRLFKVQWVSQLHKQLLHITTIN